MIILLGHTGYIGSEFQAYFEKNGIPYQGVSRAQVNYYDKTELRSLIQSTQASFLINAAGYTGKPNVDACETFKADCLLGNAVLPGILREVCEDARLPWGHVSSGCIYTGRREDGQGFTENDPPNFSFRSNNCSFYSGSKALGEEILDGAENCYIWRLRIPFHHIDSPRNYLSKLIRYEKLLEAENSISHLDDFVSVCHKCIEKQVPYGVYNVTNPGTVTSRMVTKLLNEKLHLEKDFQFFDSEEAFMKIAAKTPRSNCVLDTTKLIQAGIQIRPVEEAIQDALQHWQWQT